MSSSFEEPRLPSYNEALELGVTPSPRITWAPPSPRPRAARARPLALRPFSITSIDEAIANARACRPRSSTSQHRPSFLDPNETTADSANVSRSSSTRSAHTLPTATRPSTSQGFQAAALSRRSASDLRAAPEPLPEEPASPAYSLVPDPLPMHVRPIVPPNYAQHDPTAKTYLLRSPLIYTTTGSSPQNAAYQLESRPSKTGRPFQLAIRPLDHIESRTLSLRLQRSNGAGGAGGTEDDDIDSLRNWLGYDDDHTLYLLQVMQLIGGFGVPGLGFGPSWRIDMQRDPKGDSPRPKGFIRFEGGGLLGTGKGLMQRSACKFYYMTKKKERALKTASERRLMNKYGWQPEFEWNKRLMFSVEKKRHKMGKGRGYEWNDGKGRLMALESAEGRLDLTGAATSMSPQSREALLACWVAKAWTTGALTW